MKQVQYIHSYILMNKKRGSLENALSRIGCRFINRNDFIISFLDEFEIQAPTVYISKRLKLLYETFPYWESQKVDSCVLLCTYLGVVYKDIIKVNPQKVFRNFCDVFAPVGEKMNLRDVLNSFYIGCVTSADFMQFTEKLLTSLRAITPERHINSKIACIKKSDMKVLLDENPFLMINFRESILSKLNVGKRLDMLHIKEVGQLWFLVPNESNVQ